MTATQTTYVAGPYTRLPDHTLDFAVTRRQQGHTFPAILRELDLGLGANVQGYDAGLLNHHVRERAAQTGATLPTARRQPGLRRRRGGRPLTGARRFGVEIEVVGLSPRRAAAALVAAGLNAVEEHYNHGTRAHWKVTTDATVNGCEVVAPPMSDWADVATAMAALREAGGRVDQSTGFHVHHEVTDLAPAAVATLVDLYAAHHDELDGLVARSRRQGSARWCSRMPAREVATTAARLRRVQGDTGEARRRAAAAAGFVRNDNRRYRSLNVYSYGSYGTVEFRQHQGTLSGAKGEAWLRLGQAMILAAADGTALRVGHLVEDLAAAGHLAPQTADYLARRAAVLA